MRSSLHSSQRRKQPSSMRLLQPLFNAGENIAALRVSKSQYEESKMAYASALLNAGMDVNNAVAGIRSYRDQIDDCRNTCSILTSIVDLYQALGGGKE